jgi:YD repeat-containing protein
MRNYVQTFLYDEVGNIKQLTHAANSGSYTRNYAYADNNNQLLSTSVGDDEYHVNYAFAYHHDAHGNIDLMPHLSLMEWDFKDQLHSTQQTVANNGNGEKTYYVYDGSGQRIKKVTEQQGTTNKKEERNLSRWV